MRSFNLSQLLLIQIASKRQLSSPAHKSSILIAVATSSLRIITSLARLLPGAKNINPNRTPKIFASADARDGRGQQGGHNRNRDR